MTSGKNERSDLDILTEWATAAMNILKDIYSEEEIESRTYRDRMLTLVQALDQGRQDSIFGNETFLKKTEDLLLAMLRGERVEVSDPVVYEARNEIFAAAQVIYNQGVARGFWKLHSDIHQAMDNHQ